MNNLAAHLVELFSSVQGEGVLVGRRQVFVRFPGCNLECSYCDTVHDAPELCDLEVIPGHRDFSRLPNPVSLEMITAQLAAWKKQWPFLHHSLSITGGEPLLHSKLLVEWLPDLRSIFPVFLETNGLLKDRLLEIIEYVDMISMDIKLPSTSGHTDLWQDHAAFLKSVGQKECYVKIVVGLETAAGEVEKASSLIAGIKPGTPLILQPVTKQLAEPGIGPHLLALQMTASKLLEDVRVIPQTHTLLKVL